MLALTMNDPATVLTEMGEQVATPHVIASCGIWATLDAAVIKR